MPKNLLFSLTSKDFVVETFRAGGKGGQNQNKVESGVRIKHPASGAVAESRNHRTQLANKKAAFERLIKTKIFQGWHRVQCAKLTGALDRAVNEAMLPQNLKFEYYTVTTEE